MLSLIHISKMWPWLISGDEMLAQETTLREIAGRLTAAGEWDTAVSYTNLDVYKRQGML